MNSRLSLRAWRVAALVAVLAAGVGFAVGRAARSDEPERGSVEAVAAELADGQERDAARLGVELAGAAREAHRRLGPVLRSLAADVPVDEPGSGAVAGAVDTAGWAEEVAQASSALEAVPEGTSEQVVTRGALIGAVDLLAAAVTGWQDAATAPADERPGVVAEVAERRDAAVRLWQAGAAQLDVLTVAAQGEHVHLFLAPDGDPDSVPEEFREPDEAH